MSTGTRTPEGLARLRDARTVHGAYGAEAREMRRLFSALKEQGRVDRRASRLISEILARRHIVC
jgi:hypothetical protein